ncbi:MAG: hypothetical protein RM338_03650 [Nostoc sp. DedQUE12a]|nr:hypothetical protein [Nostoc sp. DedQUE12a]
MIKVDIYNELGYRISRELLTRLPIAGEYIVLVNTEEPEVLEPYQVWRVLHIVGQIPRIQLAPGPIETKSESDWFLRENVWPDDDEKEKSKLKSQNP